MRGSLQAELTDPKSDRSFSLRPHPLAGIGPRARARGSHDFAAWRLGGRGFLSGAAGREAGAEVLTDQCRDLT